MPKGRRWRSLESNTPHSGDAASLPPLPSAPLSFPLLLLEPPVDWVSEAQWWGGPLSLPFAIEKLAPLSLRSTERAESLLSVWECTFTHGCWNAPSPVSDTLPAVSEYTLGDLIAPVRKAPSVPVTMGVGMHLNQCLIHCA